MQKIITFLSISISVFYATSPLNAACAKCTKIEAERAEEQAKNPKPFTYYDDEMHKQQEEAKKQSSNKSNLEDEKSKGIALNDTLSRAPSQSTNPTPNPEKAFTQQSEKNFQNLNQSHQTMIDQDRNLFDKGYDPNQKYFPESSQQFQNQNDINNAYQDQEKILRGNVDAIAK